MKSKNNDKRIEKGDETYNRILLSAVDLISESGIRGITASKLSTLSNVSKSNIFHHFKTTQEIPEAVLNLIFSELIRPIDDSEAENLDEFLNYLGVSVINISKEYKKVYKTFFSFYYESMFHEAYQKILRDFLQTSKVDLTRQIKRNSRKSLSDQEANAFSTLIIATLDGIGLHILMEEEKEEYLKAWDLQVRFICNTLNNN